PRIAATEPLVTELAEFVRLIRAEETSDKLELARQVVTLAEAAESSLANGGVPVALSSYSGALAVWPPGARSRGRGHERSRTQQRVRCPDCGPQPPACAADERVTICRRTADRWRCL